MISKPEATCPRCGSRFAVKDPIDVCRHAETVTYYAECDCGAANITVTCGKVTGIVPRDPVELPGYWDEPAGRRDDPDDMAI